MSYELGFTNDARIAFGALGLNLQEDVLDALDEVARQPTVVKRRSAGGVAVLDVVRDRDGSKYYVFATIRLDDQNQRVDVLAIGCHSRKLDQA